MSNFMPLLENSQHGPRPEQAVLHIKTNVPRDVLLDAAEFRASALVELLKVLSLYEADDDVPGALPRSCRALMLLASDAQSLYSAAMRSGGVQ